MNKPLAYYSYRDVQDNAIVIMARWNPEPHVTKDAEICRVAPRPFYLKDGEGTQNEHAKLILSALTSNLASS